MRRIHPFSRRRSRRTGHSMNAGSPSSRKVLSPVAIIPRPRVRRRVEKNSGTGCRRHHQEEPLALKRGVIIKVRMNLGRWAVSRLSELCGRRRTRWRSLRICKGPPLIFARDLGLSRHRRANAVPGQAASSVLVHQSRESVPSGWYLSLSASTSSWHHGETY